MLRKYSSYRLSCSQRHARKMFDRMKDINTDAANKHLKREREVGKMMIMITMAYYLTFLPTVIQYKVIYTSIHLYIGHVIIYTNTTLVSSTIYHLSIYRLIHIITLTSPNSRFCFTWLTGQMLSSIPWFTYCHPKSTEMQSKSFCNHT